MKADPGILLLEIYEYGCPTFPDNSGARSRHGCLCCHYCSANVELDEKHDHDCLWLKVERYFSED